MGDFCFAFVYIFTLDSKVEADPPPQMTETDELFGRVDVPPLRRGLTKECMVSRDWVFRRNETPVMEFMTKARTLLSRPSAWLHTWSQVLSAERLETCENSLSNSKI